MKLTMSRETIAQFPLLNLIQRLKIGLAIFDKKGNLVETNKEAMTLLKIGISDESQYSFKDLFEGKASNNKSGFSDWMDQLIANKTVLSPTGRPHVHLELQGFGFQDLFYLSITDVSKRIEEELELTHLKNQLQAFGTSSKQAHILISKDLKVIAFNKQAEINVRLFYGKTLTEKEDFKRYIVPGTEELFFQHFDKALSGNAIRYELPILFPNGQELWFIVEYLPIWDDSGELFGISFNTINENDLISTRKQLEIQNQKLKEIARIQSHDIRRPLASIMGIADLMKQTEQNPLSLELLNLMEKATNDLDEVIKRIVDSTSLD